MEIEFVGISGSVFTDTKVESISASKIQQNLLDISSGYELEVCLMGTSEQVFKT
jgi:hypothetical protein